MQVMKRISLSLSLLLLKPPETESQYFDTYGISFIRNTGGDVMSVVYMKIR